MAFALPNRANAMPARKDFFRLRRDSGMRTVMNQQNQRMPAGWLVIDAECVSLRWKHAVFFQKSGYRIRIVQAVRMMPAFRLYDNTERDTAFFISSLQYRTVFGIRHDLVLTACHHDKRNTPCKQCPYGGIHYPPVLVPRPVPERPAFLPFRRCSL